MVAVCCGASRRGEIGLTGLSHITLQIPAYAGYRLFKVASPYIFGNKQGNAKADAKSASAAMKEGMSKRQQKMQARYEKGDKRYQMQQRQVPQ